MKRSLMSVGAAMAWLVAAPAARAELVTTLGAPPAELAPGAPAPVTLFFLNTGPGVEDIDAADTVSAKLTASGVTTAVELRRIGPATKARLEPGQFAQAPYQLTVPSGFNGSVVLELDRFGSPRTALAVAGPAVPADVAPPRPGPAGSPATRVMLDPTTLPANNSSGIAEYVPWRFSAHEPMYFIAGDADPIAKFQISFKYQIFDPESDLVKAFWPIGGVHVAYSQTSLWDLESDSVPFFDSSYRPELLWVSPEVKFDTGPVSRVGVQGGLAHESNGKSGADSRSLNIVYIRPSVTFGDRGDGLFLTFAPKLLAYVGEFDSGNADIKDYRGYGELSLITGQRNGLQLRTTARIGDDWDKGSVQLDLSYPLGKLTRESVDLYLHAQYFNGFGETLLEYNESQSVFPHGPVAGALRRSGRKRRSDGAT